MYSTPFRTVFRHASSTAGVKSGSQWRTERGIHAEVPPTVPLGDPGQDRGFPRRLLREVEQQTERVPQEFMLALEVRSREHRPRLRAAGKEGTVEVLEEAGGDAAAVVARLRRRHRISVHGFAARAHAACLA